MSSPSVKSLILQPYDLPSLFLRFLRVNETWLPVIFPDTLPLYAVGGITDSRLPSRKDISNLGGVPKASEEAANPHSTLVKGLRMAQVKFIEEPTVPFTVFPP